MLCKLESYRPGAVTVGPTSTNKHPGRLSVAGSQSATGWLVLTKLNDKKEFIISIDEGMSVRIILTCLLNKTKNNVNLFLSLSISHSLARSASHTADHIGIWSAAESTNVLCLTFYTSFSFETLVGLFIIWPNIVFIFNWIEDTVYFWKTRHWNAQTQRESKFWSFGFFTLNQIWVYMTLNWNIFSYTEYSIWKWNKCFRVQTFSP